jgi:membrane protease YdiL (CAAX protease family)
LIEIGTAAFFGAAYTSLHPRFLVGTLLAVVLNFMVLLLALFIIGKGASTFSLVGLVFDTQFKYYVFVIAVPLSLVFSPASLHNLSQITTAVKLLSTINTSIFAPFVEEFIYRGLVFRKMFSNGFGLHKSMVISTLLFCFIHWNNIFRGQLFVLLSAVLLGVINCYIYFYTERLTFPIIFHALGNLA